MKWNRKYASVVAGVVIVAVAAGGIGYYAVSSKDESIEQTKEQTVTQGESLRSFTESGTTQIKTESQTPEFSVAAVSMTVDEVYVEAGTTVEEGTALFKLTDESMKKAKAYYEDAILDAQDALETAQLELVNGTLEAENQLQDATLAADTAQSSYDAAVAELTITMNEKKEAYDNAVAKINQYQNALNDGTYYNQVGATEKQAAVDAASASVTDAQAALAAAQSTYTEAQNTMTTDMASLKSQIAANASYESLQTLAEQVATDYANVQMATQELAQKQTAADTAQSALDVAKLNLENAGKEYNSLVEEANEKLTELYSQLETLKEAYNQAERDAVTAQATIQKEYEEAVLAGKYAGTEYEAALAELADAVETAEETYNELLAEQEALNALENGVVCADRAGILASVTYEAEDVLIDGVAFVSYYNTDTIYISVEVAQEQVALLSVGDEVDVSVSGSRGKMTGKISSIATEKTSGGSMSNVTYAVVVTVDNSEGRLSSGSSATVVFDYEKDKTEGVE